MKDFQSSPSDGEIIRSLIHSDTVLTRLSSENKDADWGDVMDWVDSQIRHPDTLCRCTDPAETDVATSVWTVLQSKVSHLLSGTVSEAMFTGAILVSLLRHNLSWRPLAQIANHSQQPSFGKVSCWHCASVRTSAQVYVGCRSAAPESKLHIRTEKLMQLVQTSCYEKRGFSFTECSGPDLGLQYLKVLNTR